MYKFINNLHFQWEWRNAAYFESSVGWLYTFTDILSIYWKRMYNEVKISVKLSTSWDYILIGIKLVSSYLKLINNC